jgi:hypothetical protein
LLQAASRKRAAIAELAMRPATKKIKKKAKPGHCDACFLAVCLCSTCCAGHGPGTRHPRLPD